jgi:hypothetical protein
MAHVCGTSSPAKDVGDPIGGHIHLAEVVAEHLDRDVATHARYQLIEPHLDGLGDLVRVSGEGGETLLQALHQLFR